MQLRKFLCGRVFLYLFSKYLNVQGLGYVVEGYIFNTTERKKCLFIYTHRIFLYSNRWVFFSYQAILQFSAGTDWVPYNLTLF